MSGSTKRCRCNFPAAAEAPERLGSFKDATSSVGNRDNRYFGEINNVRGVADANTQNLKKHLKCRRADISFLLRCVESDQERSS